MQIQYIQDSGHGWFKVTPAQQEVLGLTESMFSEFSYVERDNDGTIYAEEDCDCEHIFLAAEAKGIALEINAETVDGDSFIRTLDRCR
tara:strand:+ start:211 stop:474 length:264 start_codon:yes stop_codon:yes gene_type:complete